MATRNWQEYWNTFVYFQTSKDDCSVLRQMRQDWPNFVAKRMLNDYKSVLNKLKIPSSFDIIPSECFSFITFLYFGKVYDKKEYIQCLENVVKYELEQIQYDQTDDDN